MKTKLIACLLVLFAVACVVLYYLDPVKYVFMPKCPFKMLTGLDCPGCGFQRAMHALLHGHVMQAIRFNFSLSSLFLTSLPLLSATSSSMVNDSVRFFLSSNVGRQFILTSSSTLCGWW